MFLDVLYRKKDNSRFLTWLKWSLAFYINVYEGFKNKKEPLDKSQGV